ncbi:cleft lip and palate transmembrane protein 1-domain-containing protein [Endogone sp. FLAS-F59071]|nr:cleft lip and palate transmembrane protein 1-domain-containing protein [Endogone sp. FLAS-F59071]|eukprot:RUS16637.1 cleft lip and palate transmembrane protein 1-domain-containing protein [Endogone sp. FLAS-F59071]
MGVLSTVFTIVTVSLFTVYVFNAVFNIILHFNPLFYVPLLRPAPVLPPNAQYHEPVYSVAQAFDLTVYITHSEDKPEKLRYIKPAWRAKNLTKEGSFSTSKELNYTLGGVGEEAFLHAFLTVTGRVPDKQSEKYDEFGVHVVDRLVKVMPILVNDTRNLLSEGPVPEAFRDGEKEETVLPHWKPKTTLQVVLDTTRYPHNTIPPDLAYRMNFIRKPPYPYLPLLDTNDMSVKRTDWLPLNFTSSNNITVSLQISISLTSLGMYRLANTLESAFGQMLRPDSPFRISDTEVENLRGMVFEVNPTLLAVTLLASLLHLLFEFLAIKEDVVHWRKIKYGEAGVSRTTVMLNAVSNTVVVGYLFDKREETSMLVVGGSIVTALGKYCINLFHSAFGRSLKLFNSVSSHFTISGSFRLLPSFLPSLERSASALVKTPTPTLSATWSTRAYLLLSDTRPTVCSSGVTVGSIHGRLTRLWLPCTWSNYLAQPPPPVRRSHASCGVPLSYCQYIRRRFVRIRHPHAYTDSPFGVSRRHCIYRAHVAVVDVSKEEGRWRRGSSENGGNWEGEGRVMCM